MRAARFLSALLLSGLLLSATGRLEGEPPKSSHAARSGAAAKRGPRVNSPAWPAKRSNLNLFALPTQTFTLPRFSPWLLRDPSIKPPPSRRRPIFTLEGILLGDYYLVPNLALGTDNRYDDANTRERALRDEMNYQEARRRGELREDPLTQLLRKRVPRLGGDPGFKVALVIRHLLQGALPTPTKSVDLTQRPDGQAPAPAAAQTTVASPSASPLSIVSPKRYEGGNQAGSTGNSGFSGSAAK